MIRVYNIKRLEDTLKKIEPDRIYDISEMLEKKMFWWVKNFKSYISIIMHDFRNENIMRTKITGEGRGIRYQIKGRNIINFIKRYGLGIAFQSLRQKRHGNIKRD
jgi:hypothetical protein